MKKHATVVCATAMLAASISALTTIPQTALAIEGGG